MERPFASSIREWVIGKDGRLMAFNDWGGRNGGKSLKMSFRERKSLLEEEFQHSMCTFGLTEHTKQRHTFQQL